MVKIVSRRNYSYPLQSDRCHDAEEGSADILSKRHESQARSKYYLSDDNLQSLGIQNAKVVFKKRTVNVNEC